ncbi:MAG: glycosyltransferase family 2 protein [Candidatus Omnitrophica bacterium]|nr:glycosyltransferase family 2 protein [Candidatus Omnitrophota bacterium]
MAKTEPDVSINIVNWNGGKYILDCLASVFEQDYKGSTEVIVVDNGSSDKSLKAIERRFTQVKIIRNDTNLGFCKAHNQAIVASRGNLVLLLNFDILLEKNFLSEMVKAISRYEKVGMISGKLYKSFDGEKSNLIDSTGIVMTHCFSSPRGEMEEDSGKYDAPEYEFIFGPCGAAPLYRREMLEDIKHNGEYFDEDFVNYVEDVDLSWRARLRGWRAVYAPKAIAYHERGITRKNNREEQKDYHVRGYRNRYLTIYKNFNGVELKKIWFKFLSRELYFFSSSNDRSVTLRTKLRALRSALKVRKLFREKRNDIQERRVASPEAILPFFDFEHFTIFPVLYRIMKHYLISKPKKYLHDFLCKFYIGRVLVRRYGLLKKKLINL